MDTTSRTEVQRRVVAVLFVSQLVGGIGMGIGIAVGVLFAARLVGQAGAGVAGMAMVVGSAVLAPPMASLMLARGRRLGLAAGYLVGAIGAALLVGCAITGSVAVLYPAMFCFGAATTANFQARFAVVDLAAPATRGRSLSTVVWATTVGAVSGPAIAAHADTVAREAGWPAMAGPFAVAFLSFLVASAIVAVGLRPDPLLVARARGIGPDVVPTGRRATIRALRSIPAARFGVLAMVAGHLVMVSLMSMTPVHLDHVGGELGTVSAIMSAHLAGMFAASPVIGWASDRFGRRAVIAAGAAGLLAACVLAWAFDRDTTVLTVVLVLLGLSWSATLIGGSTLLTESLPAATRPTVQGLADLAMGLAGAAGSAVAGVLLGAAGYSALALACGGAVVALAAVGAAYQTGRSATG
ncbi:hypothetical protein ALI144C_05275 [Actinosynnema sp. ALI-1.44]|uniref:MFS transporter n=1 Tax=Actinosynnema sp. ALI-1.44 TaxID=1933779 RepID=UPI00097C033D|nr:MFS transporter [Actinosynnema sp. ALI-1.44]ONI89353.1 hypothetical protein ALI144C_05275 [Actinosynnema sp. ALI-1.44]